MNKIMNTIIVPALLINTWYICLYVAFAFIGVIMNLTESAVPYTSAFAKTNDSPYGV
jgi:hypothetical protein